MCAIRIHDVQEHLIARAAGRDVEPVRTVRDVHRVRADVMAIELHHAGDRHQVRLPWGTGIITALTCQRVPQKSAAVAILSTSPCRCGC